MLCQKIINLDDKGKASTYCMLKMGHTGKCEVSPYIQAHYSKKEEKKSEPNNK